MAETLSTLSLSSLLSRLHASLADFVNRLDETIEINETVGPKELSELRNHITERLNTGNEEVENRQLLEVLNLLSVNEGIVEYVKAEAEDWLAFVEAVEKRVDEGKSGATKEEMKELEDINEALKSIKADLRS